MGDEQGSTRESLLIPPDGGRGFWIVGDFVRLIVLGEQTGGQFAVWEGTAPPQGGPPLHTHEREDETFFVLEGEVTFQCGERVITAGPGSTVYAPRGVPHRYQNLSSAPARFLTLGTPAGMEEFFAEVGVPGTDPSAPPEVTQADVERLARACDHYGLTLHLPQP